MCGIIGYVGNKIKAKTLIQILKNLEYRGYDSSGLSLLNSDGVEIYKQIGNISNLEKIVPEELETTCLIAHTRWATHGKPNCLNAHPHSSKNQQWTIVHNGIIENYNELKTQLINKPKSETDTAVVAEFLEEKQANGLSDFVDVLNCVSGSFAIVAQNKNLKDTLFLAKQKSPLYVSQNESKDVLIASDPICFKNFSKKYYTLLDGEFASVSNQTLKFFNRDTVEIKKHTDTLDVSFEEVGKKYYKHFMLKEIEEQQVALKTQLDIYKEGAVFNKFDKNFVEDVNKIILIGCGTAYHASLIGSKYISRILKIEAVADVASEFIYNEPVFADSKTLFIFVSQSGETADTLRAVEIAKSKKAKTVAITNVLYSTLASKCDYVLPVCAGPEIAVASTKAYVCQLSVLYMFAMHLKNQITKNKNFYFEDIQKVSDKILKFDRKQIDKIAKKIKDKNEAIFIGKDFDFVSACEASLKLKEVAYINSSSYASGELKHGFLALVENKTPVVVLVGNEKTNAKTLNATFEAVSRGAEEFVVTNKNISNLKNIINIDEQNDLLFPMLSIAPLQYLAYKVSILKNINPDQPRNLAKSVTVE